MGGAAAGTGGTTAKPKPTGNSVGTAKPGGSGTTPTAATAKAPKILPDTSGPGASQDALSTVCSDLELDGKGSCGDTHTLYLCSNGALWSIDCNILMTEEYGYGSGVCVETSDTVDCVGCFVADDGTQWCCTGRAEPGDICCSQDNQCVVLVEDSGTGGPDSCQYANDGECDEPDPCPEGTDTTDCAGSGVLCDDTCEYAGDGACDDGGFGSESDVCEYGTDCTDCGAR